jgi:hypothetical protein
VERSHAFLNFDIERFAEKFDQKRTALIVMGVPANRIRDLCVVRSQQCSEILGQTRQHSRHEMPSRSIGSLPSPLQWCIDVPI